MSRRHIGPAKEDDAIEFEWTYAQITEARRIACERLGIENTPQLANGTICRALGIKADNFRPQRLILWAAKQ